MESPIDSVCPGVCVKGDSPIVAAVKVVHWAKRVQPRKPRLPPRNGCSCIKMSPLQTVIVTRTFWPLVGAAETTARHLAVGLVEAGWPVTVLTARCQKQWPSSIRFHNARVERIGPRPDGRWAEWWFRRALGRWLRRHAGALRAVYVFGLRQEANAALLAVGRKLPVVLRVQADGPTGDDHAPVEALLSRWKLRQPEWAALVCRCEATRRRIEAAGWPADRIRVVPDGVTILPSRTCKTRTEARTILAGANNTLRLPDWAPLAIYLGRLADDRGLECLMTAWPPIARQWPNARLWFVGDGPFRDALRRRINGLKLSGRAMLVGRFDHVEELLAAADVLVYPGQRAIPPLAVSEAMGAGLPVIAADSPGNRVLVEHDQTGWLVAPDSIEALTGALTRVFGDPTIADRLGRAAHEHARRNFALAQMVQQHVTLLESLRPIPPR